MLTEYRGIGAHRDAMVRALATEMDVDRAQRSVDTLLNRIRRLEELDILRDCNSSSPHECAKHGPMLRELEETDEVVEET